MTSYQWNRTANYIEQANVSRLARAHGLVDIRELRARSVTDAAWFRARSAPTWAVASPVRLMKTN